MDNRETPNRPLKALSVVEVPAPAAVLLLVKEIKVEDILLHTPKRGGAVCQPPAAKAHCAREASTKRLAEFTFFSLSAFFSFFSMAFLRRLSPAFRTASLFSSTIFL